MGARDSFAIVAAIIVWLGASDTLTLAQYPITPIFLSGQPAPDAPPGAVFGGFVAPAIDAEGQIAFTGGMQPGHGGVTTFDSTGIWAGPLNYIRLVARANSVAVGVNDGARYGTTGSFYIPLVNAGRVFFNTSLEGTNVTSNNSDGLWAGTPLSIGLVARRGNQAPGMPAGTTFGINADHLYPGAINSSGQLAFTAFCKPSGEGLWMGAPGLLNLVAKAGQVAPGTGGGQFSNVRNVHLNDAGTLAFDGNLMDGTGGVTSANDSGIWTGPPTGLSLAVRAGDIAPGMPTGAVFTSVGGVLLKNTGQLLFGGSAQGAGITPDNNSGVWSGVPGDFHMVFRTGTQAPGLPAGKTFSGTRWIDGNNAGQILLAADVTGGDTGIWAGLPEVLKLIAHRGQMAPGSGGQSFLSFTYPYMNDHGAVAFAAYLGNVEDALDGIWAADPAGDLRAVAVIGQPFQVGVGDVRTVASFQLRDHASYYDQTLANNDMLVFEAAFTDGSSGIFTAQVPEPSTAMGLLGLAILATQRRLLRRHDRSHFR